MKTIKKYLVSAIIGSLIFGSGILGYTLASRGKLVHKSECVEDLVKTRGSFVQTLFDKEIDKIQATDFYLSIDFKDGSLLEMHYDVVNMQNKFPSRDEIEKNMFTYNLIEVIEKNQKGTAAYESKDLTPAQKRFYKAILKNMGYPFYYR